MYILLDVLFEHNHYSELINKKIANDLILTEPEYQNVIVPSANCILADKLTAFAPHTTGIRLNVGKDMEVIKQFYDISSLLDVFTDFKQIYPTYADISQSEAAYRGIEVSPADCLWDTFNSSLCIAARGKIEYEEYRTYVNGIRELKNHIYAKTYTPEIAAKNATKIMYLCICLLTNTEFIRVENSITFLNIMVEHQRLQSLCYLRKASSEAYAYLIKTDQLLSTLEK